MKIYQLFYQSVLDGYGDEKTYQPTGDGLYTLGVFSSREKALQAARDDVARNKDGSLETRKEVPAADEGMVRVVDGEPRGYFFIFEQTLDKATYEDLREGECW